MDTEKPKPEITPPTGNLSEPKKFSRRTLGIAVVILLVVVLAGLAWHHSRAKKVPVASSEDTSVPVSSAADEQEDSNYQYEANVTVDDTGIIPATITVKPHTRVYFENKGSKVHYLQANQQYSESSDFGNNEMVPVGGGFAYNFQHAGDFLYHDSANPTVNAEIIVK
jgi:plastocyanin